MQQTVNEILDRYEREYLPTLGPRTRKDYARHIAFLRPIFGARVASELTSSDFDSFMNVETGRVQRNRQLAVISSAFTKAVFDWKWLSHNVCMQVARNPMQPRNRYVTTDEFERFKIVTTRSGFSKNVAIAMDIALATGMIQGEILGLRWADIDEQANTITYKESSSQKIMQIQLPHKVRVLLDQSRNGHEHVVASRKGKRYTSEGFRAVWQRWMQRWVAAGHERFTFQDIHMKWQHDRKSSGVPAELQHLVERPAERPGVELKQWMPMDVALVRANVARHIAALANYGGGYLIFGFQKDGTLDPKHPGDLSRFNSDEFASIVDHYLTPAIHCDVSVVSPSVGGDGCVVVKIPSHGSVPICVKADGPHNAKGKPQGILMGRYYTRVNGPKSERVETPDQWAPIIRRCVISERQALVDSIAALLRPPQQPESDSPALQPGPKRDRRTRPPNERGRVRLGQRRRRQTKSGG